MLDEEKSLSEGEENNSAQTHIDSPEPTAQAATPPEATPVVKETPQPPSSTKKSMLKSKEFWLVFFIFAFLVFLFCTFFGYFGKNLIKNYYGASTVSPIPTSGAQVACTMEAKLCPDGVTYVSRSGPKCEFAPCPTGSASSETANWQTYTNSENGFSLKYPSDWKTISVYSQESLPNSDFSIGFILSNKAKGETTPPIYIEQYDNPSNLSIQEWDKKENEGKPSQHFLYSSSTNPLSLPGLKAYVNEKGTCEPVYCKEIIIMGDKKVIVLRNPNFTNIGYTKEETESNKLIFDQVISTFKFN